MLGSLGSKDTLATLRGGRLRVISIKVTPDGGPTVLANALTVTNTCIPVAKTT